VRYVGGLNFDPATGQINGAAFDRSPKDVDGLSVTRTGMLGRVGLLDEEAIRRAVGSRLTIGATSVFAQFNVGALVTALEEFEQPIDVVEDPLPAEGALLANPAHALILGLPFTGETAGSLKSEVAGDKIRQIVHHTFPGRAPVADA